MSDPSSTASVSPDAVAAGLASFGLRLTPALGVRGAYTAVRQIGETLWISGVTGRGPDGPGPVGVVGETVSLEEARRAARRAAANLLSAVDRAVGLERFAALGHLRGYIRAASDFDRHPAVLDAASEVLTRALGPERGLHARTALGVASLPGGAAVELDLVAYAVRA